MKLERHSRFEHDGVTTNRFHKISEGETHAWFTLRLRDLIRTTPEKLWQALIDPEFTRRYWCETYQESEWKPGASWRSMIPDGRVGDSGKILEIDPPPRLVLTWQNQFIPEMREEGHPRLTYELEQVGQSVKLTLIHEPTSPNRSSSKPCRAAGRTSWPASRACSKRENRSKRLTAGRRECSSDAHVRTVSARPDVGVRSTRFSEIRKIFRTSVDFGERRSTSVW